MPVLSIGEFGVANSAPPPGWVVFNGLVEPGARVRDFAARGQVVKANCRAEGCNRRVVIDPEDLNKEGLGAIAMTKVKALWRCHRLQGCALQFFDERPAIQLRLGQFVGLPQVRVRLRCRADPCKFARVYLVEVMIKGLIDRKQGDDRTEIDALPGKMTAGCPLCKKTNWAADVLWADTGTVGWRSGGDMFARYETG